MSNLESNEEIIEEEVNGNDMTCVISIGGQYIKSKD